MITSVVWRLLVYNQGVNFHHENLVNIHLFQLKKVKTQQIQEECIELERL